MMQKCPIKRVGPPKRVRPCCIPRKQHLHTTTPCSFTGTLSTSDYLDVEPHSSDPRAIIFAKKSLDLQRVLSPTRPDPNRVWGCYIDLLNVIGFQKLPLEVHQAVLRKCSPPSAELRVVSMRRLPSARLRQPHIHESRFQAIIRNIRASGYTPTLDDYHVILEQFAAVGHHQGVMQVLEEITRNGLPKSTKTYGLCLQALCHRLTLPVAKERQSRVVSEVTQLCLRLLNEMWAYGAPFTSVNVDLAVRVLKEISDVQTYEHLIKIAYGVDLSYPDRPPLEHWDREKGQTTHLPVAGGSTVPLPDPLPFSTAALNTTIDVLGRAQRISKLVQTFEVLTIPLPPSASEGPSTFDDDDDDDFGISNPRVAPYRTPYAEPNTQTYHILLKWLSRAGHATLARHYVLQAIDHEKRTDVRLRKACARLPRDQIPRPHFSVNRSMLLAVYAEANRDKNLELMRWVLHKIGQVIALKRSHIKYYSRVRARWQNAVPSADEAPATANPSVGTTNPDEGGISSSSSSASVFSTFFSPTSSSKDAVNKTARIPPMPYFDVDLDADAMAPSSPTPEKPFDIDLHLSLIERDLEGLQVLEAHITDVVGRTTQRIKERIGRRVWKNKDVYFHDKGDRVMVNRAEWLQKVRFRSKRELPPSDKTIREMARRQRLGVGQVATTRGLSTLALCDRAFTSANASSVLPPLSLLRHSGCYT